MRDKVLKFSLTSVCLLMFIVSANCAEEASKIKVEAIGVRVSKPGPSKENTFWPTGSATLLQVSSDKGEFIRLDSAESKLNKISDDTGADLLAKVAGAVDVRQVVGISRTFSIDKERRNCIVEAVTPLFPTKGAKSILVSGTLTLDCATAKKETVIEKVILRSGSKITGPENLDLAVEQVGRPDYGTEPFGFILRSARELDDLAEVKFFKMDGKEIEATRVSTSSLSIFGATKIEWSYTFPERVDTVKVKLYTWSDMKKKKVDFDLKIELGL